MPINCNGARMNGRPADAARSRVASQSVNDPKEPQESPNEAKNMTNTWA